MPHQSPPLRLWDLEFSTRRLSTPLTSVWSQLVVFFTSDYTSPGKLEEGLRKQSRHGQWLLPHLSAKSTAGTGAHTTKDTATGKFTPRHLTWNLTPNGIPSFPSRKRIRLGLKKKKTGGVASAFERREARLLSIPERELGRALGSTSPAPSSLGLACGQWKHQPICCSKPN